MLQAGDGAYRCNAKRIKTNRKHIQYGKKVRISTSTY